MKPYILLPFALLAGLVIGGLGPKSELARMREELKEARKLARTGARPAATMSDVSNLLGIERAPAAESAAPEIGEDIASAGGDTEPAAAGQQNPESGDADVTESEEGDAEADEADSEADRRGAFEDDLDRAIDLWQTRVAIARNTFVANAHLNDSQALKFDTILDAMNVRIGTTIDEFANEAKDAEKVQTEAGIRLMNDITESMVTAYDEMDQTMPQGWRRRAGDKFSMTDFIDPEVARPLVGVEGKLEHMVVR